MILGNLYKRDFLHSNINKRVKIFSWITSVDVNNQWSFRVYEESYYLQTEMEKLALITKILNDFAIKKIYFML